MNYRHVNSSVILKETLIIINRTLLGNHKFKYRKKMALLARALHRSSRCIDNPSIKLCARKLQTSSVLQVDQRWREKRGLTVNPNNFGPLTNLPDYSFKDGRPTPIGVRHRSRIEKQREYAARIVKLTAEIDFAVERYDRLQKEESERKQKILDSKLKPKGSLLLEK